MSKNDIILPGFSPQCKLLKTVTHGSIQDALDGAEIQRDHPEDFAIAVMKPNGGFHRHSLVCMRIDEFARLIAALPPLDARRRGC